MKGKGVGEYEISRWHFWKSLVASERGGISGNTEGVQNKWV